MRILTCEQVSDGHSDKICDQIADAVVADCLHHDPDSSVATKFLQILKNHQSRMFRADDKAQVSFTIKPPAGCARICIGIMRL